MYICIRTIIVYMYTVYHTYNIYIYIYSCGVWRRTTILTYVFLRVNILKYHLGIPRSSGSGFWATAPVEQSSHQITSWLVVLTCFNHLEKYEFVNGKDDEGWHPKHVMEVIKVYKSHVWNHQPASHYMQKSRRISIHYSHLTRPKVRC